MNAWIYTLVGLLIGGCVGWLLFGWLKKRNERKIIKDLEKGLDENGAKFIKNSNRIDKEVIENEQDKTNSQRDERDRILREFGVGSSKGGTPKSKGGNYQSEIREAVEQRDDVPSRDVEPDSDGAAVESRPKKSGNSNKSDRFEPIEW